MTTAVSGNTFVRLSYTCYMGSQSTSLKDDISQAKGLVPTCDYPARGRRAHSAMLQTSYSPGKIRATGSNMQTASEEATCSERALALGRQMLGRGQTRCLVWEHAVAWAGTRYPLYADQSIT
jgi:hypothetical protein